MELHGRLLVHKVRTKSLCQVYLLCFCVSQASLSSFLWTIDPTLTET